MQVLSATLQRKRKALLLLPILVIPFLTLIFWALGGGRAGDAKATAGTEGLNLQLPHAALGGDEGKTKLGFYEAEPKTRSSELDTSEPSTQGGELPAQDYSAYAEKGRAAYDPSPTPSLGRRDPNEEKVYQKLAELNKQLSVPSAPKRKEEASPPQKTAPLLAGEDIDRLEELLHTNQRKKESDPEMEQLNSMMDKILQIQHPERIVQKQKEAPTHRQKGVDAVTPYRQEVETSLLQAKQDTTASHNRFWSESNELAESPTESNTLSAVVQEEQTLTSGATVKLRLLTDVAVSGRKVPKGCFVYGVAALAQDRLKITITSIRVDEDLLPVTLSVYDLDGLPGIHVPGPPSPAAVQQSLEQSLGQASLLSLDPSLKSQATAAAVQAAKGMVRKRSKPVEVTLRAGYRVLLKEGRVGE